MGKVPERVANAKAMIFKELGFRMCAHSHKQTALNRKSAFAHNHKEISQNRNKNQKFSNDFGTKSNKLLSISV